MVKDLSPAQLTNLLGSSGTAFSSISSESTGLLAVPSLGLSLSGDNTSKTEMAFGRIQHGYRAGVLKSSQVFESSNYINAKLGLNKSYRDRKD